jgi:aldehyde dehydrogenase (NAD+)
LKKSGEFRREQKVSNPGRQIPINGLTSPKGQGNPDIVDHFVDLIGRRTSPAGHLNVVDQLDEAIRLHNAVGAGLTSSIFTLDMREAERFVSTTDSDCGIANVNIGPSGAEIGGAFGGEKEKGGVRGLCCF